MRWGLALALIVVAAIVIATRCRSDQSTRERTASRAPAVHAKQVAAKVGRGSIEGMVVDARGPIDARVCLEADEPICVPAVSGVFRFGNVIEGKHVLFAMAKDHAPAHAKIELADAETRTGVQITLDSGGVELTGTVSDLGGGPIRGALVRVDPDFGSDAFTESNDAGRFSVWVAPGELTAIATAEGYARDYVEAVRGPTTIDFQLTPESVLSGIVVDASTEQPVANMKVAAIGDPDGIAVTDADGRFRITGLGAERYRLTGRGPRYRVPEQPTVRLGIAERREVRLVAIPAFRIRGSVRVGDKPCTRGNVSTYWDDAAIAPDGEVTLDGLAAGEHRLTIRCEQLQPRDAKVTIADKDVDGLVWIAGDGGTLWGYVRDAAGEPIPRQRIRIGSGPLWTYVLTDERGYYELHGVRHGEYELAVDRDVETKTEKVTVNGRTQHDFKLDLGRGTRGVIRGAVTDTNGKPVANLSMMVTHGSSDARGMTDRDGRFELTQLLPGTYRVNGWFRQRVENARLAGTDNTVLATVDVKSDGVVELAIVIDASDRSITGIVVDRRGKPVADAFVLAPRMDGSCSFVSQQYDSGRRVTSSDGRFTIPNLPRGTYCAFAYQRRGAQGAAQQVEAGANTKLVIDDAASITGTVTLPDGLPAQEFRIRIGTDLRGDESFFKANGRFVISDLPAGDIQLAVTAPTGSGFAMVKTVAGETRQLSIALTADTTISGRIVDYFTKQPLSSRYVSVSRRDAPSLIAMTRGVRTDANGRFAIKNAPTGAIVVITDTYSYSSFRSGIARHIPAQASVDLGDIPIIVPRGEEEEAGTLGFALVDNPASWFNDNLEVASIDPTGPAAKSGLRVGDVITSIDGIDLRGDAAGYFHMRTLAPAGTKVSLGVARGITIDIVLSKQR